MTATTTHLGHYYSVDHSAADVEICKRCFYKGFGVLPSFCLDWHCNSVWNGMVKRFIGFTPTFCASFKLCNARFAAFGYLWLPYVKWSKALAEGLSDNRCHIFVMWLVEKSHQGHWISIAWFPTSQETWDACTRGNHQITIKQCQQLPGQGQQTMADNGQPWPITACQGQPWPAHNWKCATSRPPPHLKRVQEHDMYSRPQRET